MQTILKSVSKQYEIKKSKFLCFLYPTHQIQEVEKLLNSLQSTYKDSTHICYGYLIGGIQKCSDNGEPSGTAGLPILTLLKQKELDHILCVVVRYFGGTKLGAAGLVRAYRTSVLEALSISKIVTIDPAIRIQITFSYEKKKQVDFILQKQKITYQEYDEFITYEFICPKEKQKELLSSLKNEIRSEKILEETYIETKKETSS